MRFKEVTFSDKKLTNFEFWGGAANLAAALLPGELESIEKYLDETHPEGMEATEINDFFSYNGDEIADCLGLKNGEYILNRTNGVYLLQEVKECISNIIELPYYYNLPTFLNMVRVKAEISNAICAMENGIDHMPDGESLQSFCDRITEGLGDMKTFIKDSTLRDYMETLVNDLKFCPDFAKKVLCLEDCENGDSWIWTAGEVYSARKNKDGSWSVETNFGDEKTPDIFDERFSDITNGATLYDVVRLAYGKGSYSIDIDGNGMVNCVTPSHTFFIDDNSRKAKTAEELLYIFGAYEVCDMIAEALADYATSEEKVFQKDAAIFLSELRDICTTNGRCAVEDVLNEWIEKTKKQTVYEVEEERDV